MALEHLGVKILVDPLALDHSNLDHFVAIGGLVDFLSKKDIADSYKRVADDLTEIAVKNRDLVYEYTFPIIFLYRHSLELNLKALFPMAKRSHKFDSLIDNLRKVESKKLPKDVTKNLIDRLNEFKQLDNKSTRFRYGNELGEEFIINLKQLRQTINDMTLVLKKLQPLPIKK